MAALIRTVAAAMALGCAAAADAGDALPPLVGCETEGGYPPFAEIGAAAWRRATASIS